MHGIVQSSLLCLVFIWTAASLTSLVHSTSYVHHIEVSTKGHDNTSCLNLSLPCKTLGYVLENLKNSTQVSISNGNYTLDKNYNISYLQNLAFKGLNRSVKIQCSSEHEVGLQFRFCDSVVFEQLEFEGCGRLEYSAPFHLNSSLIYNKIYSGISLTYCKDLDIKNCTFAKSAGIALLLYDVGGKVSVVDSDFVYNTGKNKSKGLDAHKTGGGVLLHLTQFGSLYPFNDTIHTLFSNDNNYIFKGCRFTLNGYKVKDKSQKTPQPFGHGSGLTVFLCGSAKNNSLLIDTCQFQSNTAIWGGGVFTEFHDNAEGNALRMIDSEFTGNYAEFGGGAVRTGNNIKGNESLQQMENTVDYERNKFFSNYAALGGAVSHFGQTYPHIFGECKNSIRFANCTFENNTATMGSAIAVALNNKNNWIEMGPEIPYCAEISDSKIENNLVKQPKKNKDNDHVVGMGVVYSSKVPLILRGYNTFTENNNTALLLDNAPLKVFNNTFFMKNFGYKGGALALYGQARLIMTKGSRLNFTKNSANEKGGALFIRTPGPEVAPFKTRELRRHECPIGYEDEKGKLVSLDYVKNWDTHIYFINNSAQLWGGFSLYATTLQSCYLANESIGNNTAFQWKNIFTYSCSPKKEISTDPVKIYFKKQEWSVAPDEAFDPMIELLDEKHSTVYGIVKIQINGRGYTPSLFPESLFLVQSNGSSSHSVIHGLRLRGVERYNFTLTISSVGGQVISNSFTQQFKHCYDGFEQKDKKRGVCSCMTDTVDMHEGVFNCTTDGKHVNLKTGYWGGQVTKGKFVTYPCPQHYCNFDENKLFYTYNKSKICADNRDSSILLCGKCKKNFTLSLGGEKCVKTSLCGNNFSILWGIPVFVVVTPLVILILLRINVDIFTSYLNSWLYFYQVLPFVLKVETMMKLDPAMQGILDLASWKLPGVQLHCFVKKLDNIGKLGFNYLVPLYMLAILIIISLTARCCCNCYQRTNVFRAISSILVLCYTNLTMISFNVVHWVNFQKDLSVLYIEGSITSDNIPGSYYALLVLAIIIIIFFVIVFPILLLCRPFFIRNFHFMNYFTQLYNIFQHCFQDHLGFFSAYYFICRIALLVLAAALSTPGPYKRCWTEILVFLTLVIFVYVQPYRRDTHLRWLNTVDTIILSVLCLMAFMSSAQNTEAATKTIRGMQVCIKILSWLPMIYLAGLIIIAIRHYCKQYFPSREGYQNLDDPTSTSGT